jgi:alkylhydroperoxidase family enzyme
MTARIAPAPRPYEADMEETLVRLMPQGVEPLVLFRMMARSPRLFRRMMAGGLLDKGSISLREREIAIDRTCARCKAEYEWGVHIAFFAEKVQFGEAEIAAIVHEDANAECWSARERLIIRLVDQLHDTATIDEALWRELSEAFTDEQILEFVMLVGNYHKVSFIVNATRLPLETYSARFPEGGGR